MSTEIDRLPGITAQAPEPCPDSSLRLPSQTRSVRPRRTSSDALRGWRNCAVGVALGNLLLFVAPLAAQSPDDGFAPRAPGRVDTLELRADGRILIGGLFAEVNETARNRLAQLKPDGSLDEDFLPDISGFQDGPFLFDSIFSIAPLADGKVLIGGDFSAVDGLPRSGIARLHVDGRLDAGFDPGAGIGGTVYDIAVQPDGKIIVAGEFALVDGQMHRNIARLNADGSLDPGFNAGTGPDNPISAVALQADGRIVIGGWFTSVDGISSNRIARLHANGRLDTEFAARSGASNGVEALVIQADDSIVVAGRFTSIDGEPRNRIARLLPDGRLDPGFDPGSGVNWVVLALGLQSDGRILLGGWFITVDGVTRNRVARLHPDGRLDATFDPRGGIDDRIFALAPQADGKVVVAGLFESVGVAPRVNLARLNPDGSLDDTFDPGDGADETVMALSLEATGGVFGGGDFTLIDETDVARVARLGRNGALELDFDPGMGADGTVHALAALPDGGVVIGGEFTVVDGFARNGIARLNGDGSVDVTFNPAIDDFVFALAVQPDGRILIGGEFRSVNGIARSRVARLHTNGSLDTTFDPGSGFNDSVRAVLALPGGRVLVGGGFSRIDGQALSGIALLRADGSVDPAFEPGNGFDGTVLGLALQADGKLLAVGDFSAVNGYPRYGIARLNPGGEVDAGFDPGNGADFPVTAIAVQANGRLVIGGRFTRIDGFDRNRIARLNPDGSVDPEFDAGDGANGTIETLVLQPDGRILVAGDFTVIDGVNRARLARLSNPDIGAQRLEISAQRISYVPAGSMPVLSQLHFESSLNGVDYAPSGNASWNGEAWQMPGIVLEPGLNWIRASGTSTLGFPLQFVRQVYISSVQPPGDLDERLELLRRRATSQPPADLPCFGTSSEIRLCRRARIR